jgi:hypothetical protein
MDYKEPKTRTEKKKGGKKDVGPYSAKHVRLAAALAERPQKNQVTPPKNRK